MTMCIFIQKKKDKKARSNESKGCREGEGGVVVSRRVQPNGGQVDLLYQHFNTNITVEAFTSKP